MITGYLFILIGAGLNALSSLGVFNFALGGYLIVAGGIHHLPTSVKELRIAIKFAFVALGISLAFTLFRGVLMSNFWLNGFAYVLYTFFSVGTFFWVLKAEYIWSPHAKKRMDLLVYSVVALLHLVLTTFDVVSWLNVNLVLLSFRLVEFTRFVNLLRYLVLLFILAKLYLESRRNGPGLRRWN